MIISVTKEFSFCYGHCLPGYNGACANQHGHNSILQITIGKNYISPDNSLNIDMLPVEDPYNSMIIDFNILKSIINKEIIEKLDHKYLNEVLPEKYLPPTAENMALWIWKQLFSLFGSNLLKIKLSETPTSFVEIKK